MIGSWPFQMDEVFIVGNDHLDTTVPCNRLGYYEYVPGYVIKKTLNMFFYGSENLQFHVYQFLGQVGNGNM